MIAMALRTRLSDFQTFFPSDVLKQPSGRLLDNLVRECNPGAPLGAADPHPNSPISC